MSAEQPFAAAGAPPGPGDPARLLELKPGGAAYDAVLLGWRSRLLTVLLNGALVLGLPAALLAMADVLSAGEVGLAVMYAVVYALLLGIRFARLPYQLRAGIFVLLPLALGVSTLVETGIDSDTRVFLMLFPILTLMLLDARRGWLAVGVSLAAIAVMGYLTISGRFIPLNGQPLLDAGSWVRITVVMLLGMVVVMTGLILLESFTRSALDKEERAIQALRSEQQALERRVAERTRALQASFEVSQRLAQLLDPGELVLSIVQEVQQAFGFYHVHIYLYDEGRQNLEMAGGTGEAGQILLARRHRVPVGRGLVGRAAAENRVILAANTAADPAWLPNPLLPETRSEVAVPITAVSAGGTLGALAAVIGVLDVQHNVVNGLTEQDADLLLSIANQMAVALQNARSYRQAERQAAREALANQIYQRLQMAVDVEDVLQIAARELKAALSAEQAVVELNLRQAAAEAV